MKKTTNTISSKEACTLAHQIRRETGCSLAEAFKMAYNGQTQPETKTSWTAEELNKLFSDKASELIRKGYVIDLAGMAGSQGEVGKVIFKKNGVFYALVMETKCAYCSGKYDDRYVIWFGKYTEDTSRMRPLDTWNTLWLSKFEATWTMTFAKITDNYFVTEEASKAMNDKWLERCRNGRSYRHEQVSDRYNKAILGCIRKQKGYKGVKANEITKITRVTPYNDFTDEFGKRYYKVVLNRTQKNGRNVELEVRF